MVLLPISISKYSLYIWKYINNFSLDDCDLRSFATLAISKCLYLILIVKTEQSKACLFRSNSTVQHSSLHGDEAVPQSIDPLPCGKPLHHAWLYLDLHQLFCRHKSKHTYECRSRWEVEWDICGTATTNIALFLTSICPSLSTLFHSALSPPPFHYSHWTSIVGSSGGPQALPLIVAALLKWLLLVCCETVNLS